MLNCKQKTQIELLEGIRMSLIKTKEEYGAYPTMSYFVKNIIPSFVESIKKQACGKTTYCVKEVNIKKEGGKNE